MLPRKYSKSVGTESTYRRSPKLWRLAAPKRPVRIERKFLRRSLFFGEECKAAYAARIYAAVWCHAQFFYAFNDFV